MGWFSNMLFGKRKSLDIGKIQDYMEPAQALVNRQVGYAEDFMNIDSPFNKQYGNLLKNLNLNQQQQAGSSLMKMAAMRNVSPGQAMGQSRAAQNQIAGQGYQDYIQSIMDNVKFGGGLLSAGVGHQTGLSENLANAYVGKINSHNQRRSNNISNAVGLGSAIIGAIPWSDKKLKTNIELVGKSPKGINIYEFEYKNKSHGPDKYRGVMAEEVPFASMKNADGHEFVNYSHPDLDVEFERVD